MKKAVAGIFRNHNKEFLLFYHNFMGAFTPPGGKFDPVLDLTTFDTLKRELKEEINVNIKEQDTYLINTSVIYLETMGNYILETFFINDPNVAPMNMEPDKHKGLKWYSIEDMKILYSKSYSANIILDSYKCLDEFVMYEDNKRYSEMLLSV